MGMSTDRQCGDCSLCCKVLEFPAMDSSAGEWCRECEPGTQGGGCRIKESLDCSMAPATYNSYTLVRPVECEEFSCLWLKGGLHENLKPSKTKAVPVMVGKYLVLYLDPGYPLAYKQGRLAKFVEAYTMYMPLAIVCGDARATLAKSDKAKLMVPALLKAITTLDTDSKLQRPPAVTTAV